MTKNTRGYLFLALPGLLFLLCKHYNALLYGLAAEIATEGSPREAVTQPGTANATLTLPPSTDRKPRFALAYAISGCTETSCLGYVLNSLVAAAVLADSSLDKVILVRMMGNATRLPQEKWLLQAGYRVQYVPPVRVDNFGVATLEKFRVWELTEYDRVMFMDADMVPRCDVEFWLQLSWNGTLQDHVSFAGNVAPVTAATFIVTPEKGVFESILDVVHRHRNKTENATIFDLEEGWGHRFTKADWWHSNWRSDRTWGFKAGNSDQGLLLYYLKYMRMNVTQIRQKAIEDWREVTHDASYWESHAVNETVAIPDFYNQKLRYLAKVADMDRSVMKGWSCPGNDPPFGHFNHFAGKKKPWNKAIYVKSLPTKMESNGLSRWLYFLGVANRKFGLELPSEFTFKKGNPLGYGDVSFRKVGIPHLLETSVDLPRSRQSTEEYIWKDGQVVHVES